jgi:hypothetical protein
MVGEEGEELGRPLLKAREGNQIHLDKSESKWRMVVVKHCP